MFICLEKKDEKWCDDFPGNQPVLVLFIPEIIQFSQDLVQDLEMKFQKVSWQNKHM